MGLIALIKWMQILHIDYTAHRLNKSIKKLLLWKKKESEQNNLTPKPEYSNAQVNTWGLLNVLSQFSASLIHSLKFLLTYRSTIEFRIGF